MAGSTKKRKAASTQSDFKRLKAKVGKKALKPANVTDTSFKSASVSVQNQAVDFSSDAKLLSERGRSIQDLTTQLKHPAAAVRASAIRGLSNVVDTSHAESLKSHLSILLPAVAKCCVEEDDDVRQLGLSVLRNILTSSEEQVLRPFLALLTAYVTSALNSLDSATRLDGGRAVEILSTALPSLMSSQAVTLLPAFVGLLSDYHRQARRPDSSANKTKRKSKSGPSESKRLVLLQSLVALLNTIPDKDHGDNTNGRFVEAKPDLKFVPGGRTVNALLTVGCEERSVRPIGSIDELSFFIEGNLGVSSSEKGRGLSVVVANDIISKLRNIYIEVSQRGGPEGSRGGILLSTIDIEELALLNTAICLFWNAYCHEIMIRQDGDPKQVASLRKGFTTLLALMMESFPVCQQSSNAELVMKCAIVNADICATLMDIGGYLEAESNQINWTRKVLDYLLPRLDSDAAVPVQGDTIVQVLSKLLLLKRDAAEFTLGEKTRCKILKKVCEVFFAENMEADFARLPSSRRAAILITALLKNENYIIGGDGPFDASLQMALKALPCYLKVWRGDFVSESSKVLSALHDISRRLDPEEKSDQGMLDCLRTGMSLLFEIPKRSKRPKKRTQPPSIFEQYSEEMQRHALGLLVMIRSPTEATVNGLSCICSRCGVDDTEETVSDTIGDAILYAVHSVRRSMPMQAYLSFIVKSIGIDKFEAGSKKKEDSTSRDKAAEHMPAESSACEAMTGPDAENREQQSAEIQIDLQMAKASEASVRRAARSCILSDSAKVLSMIHPVMSEWLAAMSSSSGLDPSQKAIRFRAASSLCTMLILDMEASVLDVASELAHNLVTATCNLFALCFTRGHSNNHDSIDAFEYLMQPVMALMKTDSRLVESILDMISARICKQDAEDASDYIDALLWIVRHAELAAVLTEVPTALKRYCETIETGGSSSLERQACSLRTAVEILIGRWETAS